MANDGVRARPVFLFDGDCAFCSTCARFIERRIPTSAFVEAWQTALDTATESLKRHFHVASLDGFGLRERPEATTAVAARMASFCHNSRASCD